MPVEACVQSICDLALRFGENDSDAEESTMSRPFGVALLVAGVDADGPVLYHTDPSGTYVRYLAKAIGSASEGAQTALQDGYNKVFCSCHLRVSSFVGCSRVFCALAFAPNHTITHLLFCSLFLRPCVNSL